MKLFDVYPLFDITIDKGLGNYVWDDKGTKYLDLYGGHAVISIGHTHPHYAGMLTNQLNKIGFYSNSIQNPLQQELADKIGEASGKDDYTLFLCNSGAEANENALKLASFHNNRKKIISFTKGFHGRTSLAVAITDNKKIIAPVNETDNTILLPFNDVDALKKCFAEQGNEISSVIVEGIQGLAGIYIASDEFLGAIRELCDEYGSLYVADSVQCGYGRSGKFFSHDYSGIDADIYTMAKGMGNGFPIGGILVSPKFEPWFGMLGTTFGGNHLACAAGIAVLDVFKSEKAIDNAAQIGEKAIELLEGVSGVKEVRGRGLMIGIELEVPAGEIRKKLLFDHHIFTGSSANPNTVRLLPALNVGLKEIEIFVEALKKSL